MKFKLFSTAVISAAATHFITKEYFKNRIAEENEKNFKLTSEFKNLASEQNDVIEKLTKEIQERDSIVKKAEVEMNKLNYDKEIMRLTKIIKFLDSENGRLGRSLDRKRNDYIIIQKDKNGALLNKFHSVGGAAVKTGVSEAAIRKCLSQKQKSAGTFIWEVDFSQPVQDEKKGQVSTSNSEKNKEKQEDKNAQ